VYLFIVLFVCVCMQEGKAYVALQSATKPVIATDVLRTEFDVCMG
jgi:hypothetical protein